MVIGLFAVQNCEAANFCRCIKSKANETVTNPYNGAKHSSVVCKFDKKQVTSLSVTISDKDACVKYCKKNKSYIGSMDHGVCKDNLFVFYVFSVVYC